MKRFFTLLSLVLCLVILVGCAGTPVIYHPECDCSGVQTTTAASTPAPKGALKTGLAIDTSISKSASAAAASNGKADYDVTMVAVLVDDEGIIRDCKIDGIAASLAFDNAGHITSDKTAEVKTKNELGDAYGMVQYGQAKYEWNVQADALAKFAVGKTVTELKNGAIDETTGKAPAGSDLASTATIYLAGYVSTIEKAVANAAHLGAMGGDTLHMAAMPTFKSSADAEGATKGVSQLDVDVTALTMKSGIITSCAIDSVQAKVQFDATGALTTDINTAPKTKNELGENYGMVAWGGAKYEWNEQAASFAKYVVGKTPAQVGGIAVNESTVPTDTDLSSSVTIAIGGFKALIQKAAQ